MFDINSFNVAKNKADENYQKVKRDLDEELYTGKTYFNEFAVTHSYQTLKKALGKFFQYLEMKRNNAEPYFYIAFSAFLLGDQQLAEKYLNFSEELDPDFPYLYQLKPLIFKM
jgi:tetratricopeptide (TPR) repeat protein